MKVNINQRKKNGDIVYITIEPVLSEAGTHRINIMRVEPVTGKKTVAVFLLDTEWMVQELIIMMFGGYLAGIFAPSVTNAYRKANLEKLLDG